MAGIKKMILGIAIILCGIGLHLDLFFVYPIDFIAIVGVILVIIGYNAKDDNPTG